MLAPHTEACDALTALEQHLEPYTPAPYAQQLAQAEHERKIAALT